MPVVYSHSRLSVFEACRLRYRLKYIDRVKRDVEGIEAFLGSRVHEALEALYRDVMMGRTPAADAVVANFHRLWEEEWGEGILVADPRFTPADHRAAGEECLRRYCARHAPYRGDQTLGVEVKIGVDLPGGARLEGFADRVARDPDGWIAVHDYKTSRNLPTQAEADQDRQLALYQAGVEKMWPGAPGVRLVWHYLRFDERLVSVRSREQQAALLGDTAALVETVESSRDWPASPSPLCSWCPYWDLCPEKRHDWLAGRAPGGAPEPPGGGEGLFGDHHEKDRASAADAEEALAAAAAALGRRRAAEEDYDRARARLLDYARATGALTVEGPAGKARITLGERQELPRPGEEGHERLRAAVIAAGKQEAFSDLDLGKLLRAARDGTLPRDLSEAVGRLVRTRPVEQVRVWTSGNGAGEAEPSGEPEGEAEEAGTD